MYKVCAEISLNTSENKESYFLCHQLFKRRVSLISLVLTQLTQTFGCFDVKRRIYKEKNKRNLSKISLSFLLPFCILKVINPDIGSKFYPLYPHNWNTSNLRTVEFLLYFLTYKTSTRWLCSPSTTLTKLLQKI